MPRSTSQWFIESAKALGIKSNDAGMCHGLSMTTMVAALSGDLGGLNKQFEILRDYLYEEEKLKTDIDSATIQIASVFKGLEQITAKSAGSKFVLQLDQILKSGADADDKLKAINDAKAAAIETSKTARPDNDITIFKNAIREKLTSDPNSPFRRAYALFNLGVSLQSITISQFEDTDIDANVLFEGSLTHQLQTTEKVLPLITPDKLLQSGIYTHR